MLSDLSLKKKRTSANLLIEQFEFTCRPIHCTASVTTNKHKKEAIDGGNPKIT